jgi:hypothetical protein
MDPLHIFFMRSCTARDSFTNYIFVLYIAAKAITVAELCKDLKYPEDQTENTASFS